MKRLFLLATIFSAFALTSCNETSNKEWGTYPDSAAYVTTHIVESLDDPDVDKYYFETDKGNKIFLADNQMTTSYKFVEGERLVAYFALTEDYSKEADKLLEGAAYDCDYGFRLFEIVKVYTSKAEEVTTEEQSDAIADQAVAYIYKSISYSYGYINMVAGFKTPKLDDIQLYLVENLSTDPDETKKDYLNLELRYDSGSEQLTGSTYEVYASLSLEPFAEQLVGKKGVLLRVRTSSSDVVNVAIDIEDEDEDEDEDLEGDANLQSLSASRSSAPKL